MAVKDANYWFNQGLQLFEKDKYTEANECFDNAIALDPSNPKSIHCKGKILFMWNRYEDALLYYRQALKLYIQNPSLYEKTDWVKIINKDIGCVFQEQGKLREAVDYYNLVLAKNPSDLGALTLKSSCCFNMGKLKEAVETYNKAAEINPDNCRVKELWDIKIRKLFVCKHCGNRAARDMKFCMMCGNKIEIKDKEEIEDEKNPFGLLVNEINALLINNDFKKARYRMMTNRKRFQNSPDFLRLYATFHLIYDTYNKFVKAPNSSYISYDKKDAENVIKKFDQAINADSNSTIAWNNKGCAYFCLYLPKIKASEALECFDRAITLNPKNDIAWMNKILTLRFLKFKNDDPILVGCLNNFRNLNSQYSEYSYLIGIEKNIPILKLLNSVDLNPDQFDRWKKDIRR